MKVFFGNLKLALYLAVKSMLRGNKWALGLIIVVMAFSFVNLIFTSAILSGVMTTMDNQIINTMSSNVVISPKEDQYYIDRVTELETPISQIGGVSEVCIHLNSPGLMEYGWKSRDLPWEKVKSGSWNIIGIDPVKEARVTSIGHCMIEGTYLDETDTDQIVIGIEIAGGDKAKTQDFQTLGGIHTGEKVKVTYPNGVQREYTVKGIFRAREMMQADHLAFVTRREMVSMLGRNDFCDKASEILVKANSAGIEDKLIDQLKAWDTELQIRSWQEYGSSFRSVVGTFEIIAALIGASGLLVATIVIFIVIDINVLSKKRQIGILRAIGIPQNAVLGSFVVQALLYAFMGIALGGMLIKLGIEPYFTAYPLEIPMGLLSLKVETSKLIASATALTIASLVAGLLPSWLAMKESIIKTLWGV